MSKNIDLFKTIFKKGKRIKVIHLASYEYQDYRIDITWENESIKSAIFYSKDFEVQGWLSDEELKQLSKIVTPEIEVSDEILY